MTDYDTETAIQQVVVYVPKGGVAKTTSAAHMAVGAAQDHELDVVLLDLAGLQHDLATHFGIDVDGEIDAPISAVFGDQWDFIRGEIDDVVDRMVFETDEGPDLIPSDQGLSAADNDLSSRPLEERYRILDEFVQDELSDRYDLVVYDVPGGMENNITLNALYAAEAVVAPVRPGQFERDQLTNLEGALEELRSDWSDADMPTAEPTLELVIPAAIDRRIDSHLEFVDEIREDYPDRATEPVRSSANVGDAQGDGRTLFDVPDSELYETGIAAREAWRQATDDLLERLDAGGSA